MKSLALAAILVTSVTSLAHADMPGPSWMTREQVIKTLTDRGYTNIRELEADDGHWEGDANKGALSYEVHVDPHTGVITKSEADDD